MVLREVTGNGTATPTEANITLDGQKITEAELQAKRESGARIAETAPGTYKTLQKLNG